MSSVFLEGAVSVDENIVKIGRSEIIQELSQYPVDVALECTRRVSYSERYYKLLKESEACTEGSYLFIAFPNPDLVEGSNNVKFSELFSFRDIV